MTKQILLGVLAASSTLHSATLTWDGGGADSNWGTAANWNPDSALDAGNTLTFEGSTSLSPNNEVARIGADNNLVFGAGASAFDVIGQALRTGSVTNNSSVMQTISLSLRYNGTRSIDTGAAGITLQTIPLSTGGGRTANVSGSGDLILNGSGGNNVSFNITAGGLVLNGSTNSPTITVGNGTYLGGGGTLAGNLVVSSGGSLSINLADTLTVNGSASFTDLGFSNILGWDAASAADGTYTLIDGIAGGVTFAGSTPTESSPFAFSATKFGYFKEGSLQAVIYSVPEPSTALLGGLGLLALSRRRR